MTEQEQKAFDLMREALQQIEWSNDSKWQADCAREALTSANKVFVKEELVMPRTSKTRRCLYDKPLTEMREAWENGRMIDKCPRELLDFCPNHRVHTFLDTPPKPWKYSQYQGDFGAKSR